MSIIPSPASRTLPIVRITCDGMPFPLTSQLIALGTTHASDGAATATLRLVAMSADGGWESVLPLAPLGAMLDVAMGYDTALQSVFAGTVRGQRLRLSDAGVPELELHATAATPAALHDEVVLSAHYGATLLEVDAERSVVIAAPGTAQRDPIRVRGQVTLIGTTDVRPGALIDLRGVGDAFGGQHRIVGVQQVFSKEGWRTVVDVADTGSPTD